MTEKEIRDITEEITRKAKKELGHDEIYDDHYYQRDIQILIHCGVPQGEIEEIYKVNMLEPELLTELRVAVEEGIAFQDIINYLNEMGYEKKHVKELKVQKMYEAFRQEDKDENKAGWESSYEKKIEFYMQTVELLKKDFESKLDETKQMRELIISSYDIRLSNEMGALQAKLTSMTLKYEQQQKESYRLKTKLENMIQEKKGLLDRIANTQNELKAEKEKSGIIEAVNTSTYKNEKCGETRKGGLFGFKRKTRDKKAQQMSQSEKDTVIQIITNPAIGIEVAEEVEIAYKDGLSVSDIQSMVRFEDAEKVRRTRHILYGIRGISAAQGNERDSAINEKSNAAKIETALSSNESTENGAEDLQPPIGYAVQKQLGEIAEQSPDITIEQFDEEDGENDENDDEMGVSI